MIEEQNRNGNRNFMRKLPRFEGGLNFAALCSEGCDVHEGRRHECALCPKSIGRRNFDRNEGYLRVIPRPTTPREDFEILPFRVGG